MKKRLKVLLEAYMIVTVIQFLLGTTDGIAKPEECHYQERVRYVEYIFPGYRLGCLGTLR